MEQITERVFLSLPKSRSSPSPIRDLGQYFRKITAAFSDMEMEDAMIIGQSIVNITPEVRNIVKEIESRRAFVW